MSVSPLLSGRQCGRIGLVRWFGGGHLRRFIVRVAEMQDIILQQGPRVHTMMMLTMRCGQQGLPIPLADQDHPLAGGDPERMLGPPVMTEIMIIMPGG